jgi:hypothetical protein
MGQEELNEESRKVGKERSGKEEGRSSDSDFRLLSCVPVFLIHPLLFLGSWLPDS